MRTRMLRSCHALGLAVLMAWLGLGLPARVRADEPYEPRIGVAEPGFVFVRLEDTIRTVMLDLGRLDVEKFRQESSARSMAGVRKIELQSLDHLDDDKLALLASLTDWPALDTLILDAEITGFDLTRLREIPWLRRLELRDPVIPDAEFEKLAALSNLRELSFWKTEITDSGVARLAEICPWLTGLDLEKTLVTDAVVESLGRFDRLETLDLSGTAITDSGIARLVNLCPELTKLSVEETALTDEGLQPLSRLEHLESLDLSKCPRITDAGLDGVAGMSSLRRLDLSGLRLTDEGLLKLKGMKGLRTLKLFDFFQVFDLALDQVREVNRMEAVQDLYLLVLSAPEPVPEVVETALALSMYLPELATNLALVNPDLAMGLILFGKSRSPSVRLVTLIPGWLFSSMLSSLEQMGDEVADIDPDSPNATPFSDAALAEFQQALPNLKIIRNAEEDWEDRLSP